MEELRKEVRQLRRSLVALNDATGPTRSESADVQMAVAFRRLDAIELRLGLPVEPMARREVRLAGAVAA